MDKSRNYSYLPTTTPSPPPHRESKSAEQSPSKSSHRLHSKRFTSSPLWSKVRYAFFIFAAVANLGISVWVVIEHGNLPELFPGEHENSRRFVEAKKCLLPHLNPYSPEIKPFLEEKKRIDCTDANTDFKGRIFFKTDLQNRLVRIGHPGIPCCYRPFYRVNDNEVWIEPTKVRTYVCHNITEVITPIPPGHEFIEILCDNGHERYRDAFAFVQRKPAVEERVQNQLKAEKEADPYGPKVEQLSVIILGMDSTSQQNFIRRMPKSLDYMMNTLGAIRLDGYVKVGENTLPNVVPLLTGLGLDEFKDLCVMKYPPMDSAIHLDNCPFVWHHFRDKGYRTFYAEDEVGTSVFNLHYSHAFLEPPTDYYFRPFSLRQVNAHNVYDGFCFGPRMSIQVLLDYLEKGAATFPKAEEPMFHMTWASKLTHDDFNRLGWSDPYFLKTLRALKENGKLNHSALIILGDHGSRASELRKTRQGQLEDRLPLAYVILPPWFSEKYPLAAKNLKTNSKLITSAYDMFETLKDFTDLSKLNDPHTHYIRQRKLKVAEKKGHRRGTSLFTALPEHRGCSSAGIPPHWCICYKKKKISIKSLDVHDALSFVLRNINAQLRPHHGLCARLRLNKAISALKWHPEDAIEDSFNGNREESYKKASLLQISFTAKPESQFEVTVLFDPDHGWKFTEQIVRLDQYEGTSGCMKKQEFKKICLCLNPETLPEMDAIGTGHDAIF